jgi:hypothetical protein
LQSEDSLVSTVVDSIPGTPIADPTDVDMDGALEETQIEETPLQASPEALNGTIDRNDETDDEPVEVCSNCPGELGQSPWYIDFDSLVVGRLG